MKTQIIKIDKKEAKLIESNYHLEYLKKFHLINNIIYNATLIDLKNIKENGFTITIFKDSIEFFDYMGFKLEKQQNKFANVYKITID